MKRKIVEKDAIKISKWAKQTLIVGKKNERQQSHGFL